MLYVSYEALAGQLLRALRGRRSQVGFSRRLGYKSNVAYLWESNRSFPTAAVTLWAAERVGHDATEAVRGFYRSEPTWLATHSPTSPAGVAHFLNDLRGDSAIGEVAERVGKSRFSVSRWLKGDAEPRLPDFLRIIEATSSRLLDFLAQFVEPGGLPATRGAWAQIQAARRMVSDLPWSPAVTLILQTVAYQALPEHRPGWIAERIGIPLSVEEECLAVLETTGQIRKAKGLWQVTETQTVDTRSTPQVGRSLKSWWAEVGLRHLDQGREGLFSYNVFSISERDLKRLEEMHRAYYRAVRALVASSEPAERVAVANLQLFPLDRPAGRQEPGG